MAWLFALAVAAIVAAIDFGMIAALGPGNASRANGALAGAAGSWSVCSSCSSSGSVRCPAPQVCGCSMVARDVGAVPVLTGTGNFTYSRLCNVVSEMASVIPSCSRHIHCSARASCVSIPRSPAGSCRRWPPAWSQPGRVVEGEIDRADASISGFAPQRPRQRCGRRRLPCFHQHMPTCICRLNGHFAVTDRC